MTVGRRIEAGSSDRRRCAREGIQERGAEIDMPKMINKGGEHLPQSHDGLVTWLSSKEQLQSSNKRGGTHGRNDRSRNGRVCENRGRAELHPATTSRPPRRGFSSSLQPIFRKTQGPRGCSGHHRADQPRHIRRSSSEGSGHLCSEPPQSGRRLSIDWFGLNANKN